MGENSTRAIKDFFQNSTRENIGSNSRIFYAEDAVFEDPLVRIVGIEALVSYYEHLYENVIGINFEFQDELIGENAASAIWIMTVRHKKLNGGESITVNGSSYFKFNPEGKVVYQRDYFDAGAMLYEQIPFLGRVVKYIKQMAGKFI